MAQKQAGKFIVIEGLDGSGETTQVKLLVEYLRKNGVKAYATKEPTDNVVGGLIRGALSGVYNFPDVALQLLFAADRAHHLQRVIEPLLAEGATVVSDRYFWSSVAFGSLILDRQWLIDLQKHFRSPDVTVVLEVPVKECLRRLAKDRFDLELYEQEKKMRQVWRTYAWLARKFPRQIKIVDGLGKETEVLDRVIKAVTFSPTIRPL